MWAPWASSPLGKVRKVNCLWRFWREDQMHLELRLFFNVLFYLREHFRLFSMDIVDKLHTPSCTLKIKWKHVILHPPAKHLVGLPKHYPGGWRNLRLSLEKTGGRGMLKGNRKIRNPDWGYNQTTVISCSFVNYTVWWIERIIGAPWSIRTEELLCWIRPKAKVNLYNISQRPQSAADHGSHRNNLDTIVCASTSS